MENLIPKPLKITTNSAFALDRYTAIYTSKGLQNSLKLEIFGIEVPFSTIAELEYLAFPRMIGCSELSWSTEKNRNWENYKVRLAHQTSYLDRMNVQYYQPPLIDWKKIRIRLKKFRRINNNLQHWTKTTGPKFYIELFLNNYLLFTS